jgi:hypothetical protein
MKLLRSNAWRGYGISRVFSAVFYSTETLRRNPPPMDALHHRIWRAGDPRVPIIRVIDQWLEEGRAIEESELFRTMKQLRSFRRYGHALEVSFPIYIYIYIYICAYMYVWCNCVCVFCIWVCTDVHFG